MAQQSQPIHFEDIPLDEARRMGRGPRMDPELYHAFKEKIQSLDNTAAFAVPGSILDGMAPHVWHGATATQDWYRDVLIEGKQHGATDYFVKVEEPLP